MGQFRLSAGRQKTQLSAEFITVPHPTHTTPTHCLTLTHPTHTMPHIDSPHQHGDAKMFKFHSFDGRYFGTLRIDFSEADGL